MTKPLVTKYDVGDTVVLVRDLELTVPGPRIGDVGTVRRIVISAPEDGDDTFPMLYVVWEAFGGDMLVGEDEITPATPALAWFRRQIESLAVKGDA